MPSPIPRKRRFERLLASKGSPFLRAADHLPLERPFEHVQHLWQFFHYVVADSAPLIADLELDSDATGTKRRCLCVGHDIFQRLRHSNGVKYVNGMIPRLRLLVPSPVLSAISSA
jgi:hypothetical protein